MALIIKQPIKQALATPEVKPRKSSRALVGESLVKGGTIKMSPLNFRRNFQKGKETALNKDYPRPQPMDTYASVDANDSRQDQFRSLINGLSSKA